MKVLMTGMTLQQTGQTERMQLNYCSNPSTLAEAIRRSGHDLTWRPVVPSESLDKYDAVIVGLSNIFSFGSRFVLGAIWAAGHSNTAYLIDDWNIRSTDASIKGTAKSHPSQGLMRKPLPRTFKEEGWNVIQNLYGILDEMASGTWKRPTLGSFFPWGDVSKFKVNTNLGDIWAFDPSSLQPRFNLGVPMAGTSAFFEKKKRQWVLASLPNQDVWLTKKIAWRSKWDKVVIGHKSSNKPRLQEDQVVRLYADSWGVLCPPYKHAGSGWWRARYKYALDSYSILLAEPDEVRMLGDPFLMPYLQLEEMEERSDSELMHIVQRQREVFYSMSWNEMTFITWVDNMLHRLAEQ